MNRADVCLTVAILAVMVTASVLIVWAVAPSTGSLTAVYRDGCALATVKPLMWWCAP